MAEVTSPRFMGLPDFAACMDGSRMTTSGFDAGGDLVVDRPNDPATVEAVQRALVDLGYAVTPSGVYDDATAEAVRQFKNDQGLALPPGLAAHDGVVGPGTSRRLDELFPPQPPPGPVPVIDPATTPEHWFLDENEYGGFRAPHFTRDNHVIFHVDGESYYDALAGRCALLAAGDRVLIAGWRMSPEQRLEPAVAGSPGIKNRLLQLHGANVTVRMVLFGSPVSTAPVRLPQIPAFPSKDNADSRDALFNAGAPAILDARLPRFGSHHQKCVVVDSAAEGPWAFLGGIDLCLDRWDNAGHTNPPARQREPDFLGRRVSQPGWHDVQAAVRGPATPQVWQALVDRWNDPTPPSRVDPVPVPIPSSEVPVPTTFGLQAIQVLRTIPCGVHPWLPNGEQTVFAAYRKAIDKAQHYIYVEDQYLWPSDLVPHLAAAVARGVQLVLVTSRDYDLPPPLSTVHKLLRAEAIQQMAAPAPANVRVFFLEQAATTDQVYVHAKLMIIDDRFASAGSANLNFRSHTTDTELQVGIVDTELVEVPVGGQPTQVGRLINEVRAQLWAEHINADPSVVLDPVLGLNELPTAGAKRGHMVSLLVPPPAPAVDWREAARQLLRLIQEIEDWRTLAPILLAPLGPLASTGAGMVDLGLVADLLPDPERFIRDFLNPKTVC